ncbi:hypothetical protein K2173_024381 [Erythroxylum novogranatense]|uniref:Acyl-[acyl-carrier-protein] hydrolase n=1 Tax=Erythroxylum novogranatense TaxID=1862640 RepID=A0AAV8SV02_9ROSI|nr:hypothetical protein K2173_024381 [Erythroxylum novogranatense]
MATSSLSLAFFMSSIISTRIHSFRTDHNSIHVKKKQAYPLLRNGGASASCMVLPMTTMNSQTSQTISSTSCGDTLTEREELNPILDIFDGRLIHDRRIYRQKVTIRSFDIGPDLKLSPRALMNHLQDTTLNHLRKIGILEYGFGLTAEMVKNSLIWVVSTAQIVVDCYPAWTDVVQVDTWMYPAGKNSYGRDWLIRDDRTGQILIRATSAQLMMNKKTRKLSRYTEEIREEFAPFILMDNPIMEKDSRRIPSCTADTAVCIRSGLSPGWNDMDVNQHVSNAKYVDWILEGTPHSLMEHHELSAMTLEYRKECDGESVLQSMSRVARNDTIAKDMVELDHLLHLEKGSVIMKGRTLWRLKDVKDRKTKSQTQTH